MSFNHFEMKKMSGIWLRFTLMIQFFMSKLIFSHCTCEDLQFTHCIRLRVDKTENIWYCHKKATLMTFSDKILRT